MRSHINEAKFTKRIPTDTYAFEEYTLSAAIDPSETGEDVLIEMRRQVSNAFAADLVEATEKKQETKAAKKSAAKTEKKEEKKNAKSGKSKARPVDDEDDSGESDEEDGFGDGESVEDDEASDDQTDYDGDSDAEEAEDAGDDSEESEEGYGGDDSDEGEPEEEKPAKGKSAAKKASGKKIFKRKAQVYDRGIDQHREIFSRVLRSVSPDWKSSEILKARAKKISESLEGEDFLDENGEVLADFKATVKKQMAAKK